LKEEIRLFILDIKDPIQQMMRYWNRLSTEVVESLSLQVKKCGDVALRNKV